MITGTHAIIYAQDADKARAFFRDVLKFPHVDAHDGWLIFRLPPPELGIHPCGEDGNPESGAPNGHHEIYFMCDDIEVTVGELKAQGIEFNSPITNQGFGLLTRLRVPGAGEIGLYEPRHITAVDIGD